MIWSFLGLFGGIGKLTLVAALAVFMFGGTEALRRLTPRALQPFLPSTTRRGPRDPRLESRRSRIALGLVLAAVVAWVATRLTRVAPSRSTR